LTNVSEEKENNLQKFLLESPNVSYFVSVGGKWDYFVEIVARDAEDFNKIVKNIRWKFSDMIKEEETVSLLQEHKLNYFPFADLLDNSKLEKFYSKYYKNAKWEPKTGW
jgi:DNA-binding Lrp family transcriptional regulator